MALNRQKVVFQIILICLVTAGLVWLRSRIFSNLSETISEKLDSLKVSGFVITYDSLSVNWRKNVIEIDAFLLEKNAYDTACLYPEFIKVGKVRAVGLRLIPLIFRSVLSFEKVYLDEPHFVMRQNSLLKLDSASQRKNEFTLRIDQVLMKAAHIEYTDSLGCDNLLRFKGDLSLQGLAVDFHPGKPFVYTASRLGLDSSEMRVLKNPYTYKVLKAQVDFTKKLLSIDTIRFTPDYAKLEYGRKSGYEVDRIEGVIPFVRAKGFFFNLVDTCVVTAALAEVQFYLMVFRDKRLPFRREAKLLPTTQLRNLPVNILIDSLKIIKSYVQYEEFQNDAPEPGKIYFDDLEAVFANISNKSLKSEITLTAKGLLMGEGKVVLSAVFPMGENKKARMTGSLQHFSIPKINSMLTPVTNIRIESGTMDKLSFDFSYNARRSNGEIELNYTDLKLVTFKEEEKSDGHGMEKDNLKTFMMNTFVFRKNMDEKVPEEKRTGTVKYIRDDSRSIFNFWVKSVVSGIKSAYNLDKAEAKKTKKGLKKEERLVKREARKKLKKTAKNKEKG